MANFYGAERTNYFKVKDPAKFKAWAESFKLEICEGEGGFALLPSNTEDGCLGRSHAASGEEVDLIAGIASHLTADTVAIIIGAGSEKMRYIAGWATAFNHTGEVIQVELSDIYALAESEFNIKPTIAEY